MKDKIKAFLNSLKAFISKHSTAAIIAALLLFAIVLTLAYKGGLPDDTPSKDNGNTNSIVSTEDTTSDENSVSSDIEESTPNIEENTDLDKEQTTSDKDKDTSKAESSKPSNKKPTTSSPGTSSTNKTESTDSKPSTSPSTNTSTTTATVPSQAFLNDCGLTLEQSQAIVEAAKTCKHCGKSTTLCHRYGIDIACYDCGELAKANTCHFCK